MPEQGGFKIEPRCPGGCHDGSFADFDHYCDAAGIKAGEEGPAFAAWMNALADWDGDCERVEEEE